MFALAIVHMMLAVVSDPVARRVCVLQGLATYAEPDGRARITRSTAVRPSRLDAGTYLTLAGERSNGFLRVKTLSGAALWVAERTSAGRLSLCVPASVVMKVCGDSSRDVPIYADFAVTSGTPVARLARDSLVQSWEYFEDRGRWTFVEHQGQVGFVPSDSLCHNSSQPPDEEATKRFSMISAPAGANCYQQHRTRAASEIHRIVIHNSEHTLKSAIATFQRCDPNHPTSAHVAIDRDGRVHRLVEDRYAAFHTGANHGGMNAVSLGIELIASAAAGTGGMTAPQERSLVELIRFWSARYHIEMPAQVLSNTTRTKAYADIEYWDAPVTVHRLVSAGRGTDCPKFVWDDTAAGDDAFFEWRRIHLGASLPVPLMGGSPLVGR
jgi:N-acetyl-anhydromuramyl-L-alanine amidase AmpD